jgi:N-acetylglucosaminyldiphosphoundecaprenol N-acetyl-beta-D-mannosaminyltransferase
MGTVALQRGSVLGCPIDPVTLGEAVAAADAAIIDRNTYHHLAMNAAKLVRLQHDPELGRLVGDFDLVTADGQAVVWAGRLLGHRLPERVTGIDLMNGLLELADRRGYRIFLLGARPTVVAETAARLVSRFPGLRLAGYRHGYFDAHEEESVVEEIRRSQADLLFVALETPAKELFLARNRERLGVAFAMGVGGAFDVIAGRRKRAPRALQRAGLEWLWRVLQDPRHLAKRYAVGNTKFVWLVARAALRRSG